ncbi:uncharacterized protein LOC113315582 [Papaver somniferum]|uniref:uncharacterized protein LOC113315582 n=1 Tax=Papaver somniferum TaxID=3469 RepID=UPI000E6F8EDA|nr:uncharacterized protein LOC113315582 [Papaver somniferum]
MDTKVISQPVAVFIAEPKVVCSASFCSKLNLPGMENKIIHNSVSNKKGNIWLFWNKTLPEPKVVSMSIQLITVDIGGALVSGIMHMMKKIGGRAANRRSMQEFNDCLNNCELMLAPKSGLMHSWSNCQHGNKRILCNLDISIYNHKWFQMHEDWSYKVGVRISSDHSPLLGGGATIPKPSNAPFKFQKMWLTHPEFMEVVSQSWDEDIVGDPPYVFQQKVKRLKNVLKLWNWSVFGNIHVKIKEAGEEVIKSMAHSDQNPQDIDALNNLVAAENDYNSREVQLNTMLKQKERINWIKEGSSNTGFFHTNLKIRQSKSLISELEDLNVNLVSDQKIIAETLVHHFKEKFQYQQTEEVDSLLEVIPNVVTEEDQQMLDAIPDAEEIKSTIFSMDPDSSPRPDGFSGCFYRDCWSIIHHDVIQAVQFCWRRQFIPKGLNSNFLVLLPKTGGAKTPNQFRPIGLSNVSFKIFTKIINTRLSSLLPKLISPQQVAYIKGRSIQEQIMLALEMVNEIKKKRRDGNVGLKLEISQAYDSVSWDFLFKGLSKYGFSNSWCHWLKVLFESSRISVMVNGGPHGFFSVGRVLTQGDPLSATLFVIMEDILSRSIHQRVAEGLIQPMVIRKGIHPTHLSLQMMCSSFAMGQTRVLLIS